MNKLVLFAFLLGLSTAAFANDICKDSLTDKSGIRRTSWFLHVKPEGMAASISTVTYRLSYKIKNLGVDPIALKGKDILLVGEGFGALVEALDEASVNFESVDPLYQIQANSLNVTELGSSQAYMFQRQLDFIAKYKRYLSVGVAQNLPVSSGSRDVYLSHMLYHNFLLEDRETPNLPAIQKALSEMVRVLKPGGVGVIADDVATMPAVEEAILSSVRDLKDSGRISEFEFAYVNEEPAEYDPRNGFSAMLFPDDRYKILRVTLHK